MQLTLCFESAPDAGVSHFPEARLPLGTGTVDDLPQALAAVAAEHSREIIPHLFEAIMQASGDVAAKTASQLSARFASWMDTFGAAVPCGDARIGKALVAAGLADGEYGEAQARAYLAAVHSYIALVAKLAAALSLGAATHRLLRRSGTTLQSHLRMVESGQVFTDVGIRNMSADPFASLLDDGVWPSVEAALGRLTDALANLPFGSEPAGRKPQNLFAPVIDKLIPAALRRSLGDISTPAWLATHMLSAVGWHPHDPLLDPTCGTGTFLLEALDQRLAAAGRTPVSAAELLADLHGIDLNPLAVLCTKASLVVALAPRLTADAPVVLPVFVADAVAPTVADADGVLTCRLPGTARPFRVPAGLIPPAQAHEAFDRIATALEAGLDGGEVASLLKPQDCPLAPAHSAVLHELVSALAATSAPRAYGAAIGDTIAAGAIPPVPYVVGNPPWVRFSTLPALYREVVASAATAIGAGAADRFVGGVDTDLSVAVTMQILRRLSDGGRAALVLSGALYSNAAGQRLRQLANADGAAIAGISFVEDLKSLAAFPASGQPLLVVMTRGETTRYPVPYRRWEPAAQSATADEPVRLQGLAPVELRAMPVPGTVAGPWIKGSQHQLDLWSTLFDVNQKAAYRARKGVTTDRNGIYWVRAEASPAGAGLVRVTNDPSIGRTPTIPAVTGDIEPVHLFPLIRGRGVAPFVAALDPDFRVIVPQRDMHGDPSLRADAPQTFEYLNAFRDELERRSSYRRFQKGQPFWSLWSTGTYSFAPYKVLWREMGTRFGAAYVGPVDDPLLGRRVVVCDHKLYMVALETLEEAQYLTALLNAPSVADAVSAYASSLSLGTSVVEYLRIPQFVATDPDHRRIAELCGRLVAAGGQGEQLLRELNACALRVIGRRSSPAANSRRKVRMAPR